MHVSSEADLVADAAHSASAPMLGNRDLTRHAGWPPNSLRYWLKLRVQDGPLLSALRIARNYLVIEAMKYCPSVKLRTVILRTLGMKLGDGVTIANGVELDFFYPDLIEIGDNTIIGLNSMIITHEIFHDHFRIGPVRIGANVIVGARSVVLAGVRIGSGSIVSAASFVNRSVPERVVVRGNPIAVARPVRGEGAPE